MSNILSNVRTYQVPFEKASNDRFIEDVDSKLGAFEVEDGVKASYQFISTTKAVFTIRGRRANYVRVTSNIFKNRSISYWFLTDIVEVESSKAVKYSATLDVFATFGLEAFTQLRNKEVNIKRMHEDRYIEKTVKTIGGVTDTKKIVSVNDSFIATKMAEFNTKNKYGNRTSYSINKTDIYAPGTSSLVTNDGLYISEQGATLGGLPVASRTLNDGGITSIDITKELRPDDVVTANAKVAISVINEIGERIGYFESAYPMPIEQKDLADGTKLTLFGTMIGTDSDNKIKVDVAMSGVQRLNWVDFKYTGLKLSDYKSFDSLESYKQTFYAIDIKSNNVENVDLKINNKLEKNGQHYFSYALIQSKLSKSTAYTENKTLYGSDVLVAPIDINGKGAAPNNIAKFEKLQKDGIINIFISPFPLKFSSYGGNLASDVKTTYAYNLINIKGYDAHASDTTPDIYVGTLSENQINRFKDIVSQNGFIDIVDGKIFIKADLDANGKLKQSDIDAIEKYDLGILPSLNMEHNVSSNSQEIDLSNYDFVKDQKQIEPYVNEMGIVFKVKNNEFKYSIFTENNLVTFFTDQAASYLQTNKNSIEAQKKRIDLESQMQLKQNQAQLSGAYSGGVVGGMLSALNPASWATSIFTSQERDIARDLSTARKSEIDAHINDLSNSASIINLGNEHSLMVMQETGLSGSSQFHTKLEVPNGVILSKINNFVKRFGYLYGGYKTMSEDVWKSRETFNFLQIANAKDELSTTDNIDIDILEEIDKELAVGIRIWHVADINYSRRNIENKLKKYIP